MWRKGGKKRNLGGRKLEKNWKINPLRGGTGKRNGLVLGGKKTGTKDGNKRKDAEGVQGGDLEIQASRGEDRNLIKRKGKGRRTCYEQRGKVQKTLSKQKKERGRDGQKKKKTMKNTRRTRTKRP